MRGIGAALLGALYSQRLSQEIIPNKDKTQYTVSHVLVLIELPHNANTGSNECQQFPAS